MKQKTDPAPERLPLEKEVREILEEARMILPGVQTLLGFQFIATFSEAFRKDLGLKEQVIHLAALALVAIAMALIMAPAAYHLQVEPDFVSQRFARLATVLLSLGMVPLTLGLSLDLYLVSFSILNRVLISGIIALVMLAVFTTLWFLIPQYSRIRRKSSEQGRQRGQ